MDEYIGINDIIVVDRQRQDLGDIGALAESIKIHGLIQPIVIEKTLDLLVVGGRRLAAVKKLGWTQLLHGRDFIFKDERDPLSLAAIELEENLQRKELSWQEEIDAKNRLLALMQSKYGTPSGGAPTRAERLGLQQPGFGVNKLAIMLGESATQTSKDLELAKLVKLVPSLLLEPTKTSAMRKVQVLLSIATMSGMVQPKSASVTETAPQKWILYEGDFRMNADKVPNESVDLVYTDLPYGVDMDSLMSRHATGTLRYEDTQSVVSLLPDIAKQSYRILKNNRYAVFWFGFRYHCALLEALITAGFRVDAMPFIWYKAGSSAPSEQPHMKYGIKYDAALICAKGSPIFIRQGQPNVMELPATPRSEKLQVAQQPIALPEKLIRDMVVRGATILDWCAGAGTTGVAALRCGCKVILFEQDKLCCEATKGRMMQEEKRNEPT